MATLKDVYQDQADYENWDAQGWGEAYDAGDTYTGGNNASGGSKENYQTGGTVTYEQGTNKGAYGYSAQSYSGGAGTNDGQPWSAANYPVSGNYEPTTYEAGKSGRKSSYTGKGAGGGKQSYATVSESRTMYQGQAPTFEAPVYDEKEVRKRARKLAAPALRRLEMQIQGELGKYYENPNVRGMVVRDSLAGYGIGMGEVLARSESQAYQQYGAEHARLFNEAMTKYNVDSQKYSQSAVQVSTSREFGTKEEYEKYIKSGGKV